MIFGWFDTKEVVAIGIKLADDFSVELERHKNKNPKNGGLIAPSALNKLFFQADQLKVNGRLNFFKKSKLANEFRWRLRAIGYSEELVDKLTKELLLYMN
jgi:hypothetical protein